MLWLMVDVPIKVYKMYYKHNFTLYIDFLTTEPLQPTEAKFKLPYAMLLLLFTSISFLSEIYISVKVKKLPWCQLKTVAIGHTIMAITALLLIGFGNQAFHAIRHSLIFVSIQLLYVVRYRDFMHQAIKNIMNRNEVAPTDGIDELEMNVFGVSDAVSLHF